jgi:hypothetical protein
VHVTVASALSLAVQALQFAFPPLVVSVHLTHDVIFEETVFATEPLLHVKQVTSLLAAILHVAQSAIPPAPVEQSVFPVHVPSVTTQEPPHRAGQALHVPLSR